jgi:hypothetical protein
MTRDGPIGDVAGPPTEAALLLALKFSDLSFLMPQLYVLAVQKLFSFLLGLIVVTTPKLEAIDYVAVGSYNVHAIVLHGIPRSVPRLRWPSF